jgi:multidrug efflux pump subunit AcrA (membrane-fusion protein)
MDSAEAPNSPQDSSASWIFRASLSAVLCVLLIGGGLLGFKVLISLKAPPKKRSQSESVFSVKVIDAVPTTYRTPVNVFGTVRAAKRVVLTPEVRGTITELNSKLKAGRLIKAGELLFRVDTAKYVLKVEAVKAKIAVFKANIERLEQERLNAVNLCKHVQELVKVAEKDVSRLEELLKGNVGTISQLEGVRKIALQQRTSLVNSEGQLALIRPRKIELERQLDSAQVELKEAELDVKRASVFCPFRAKVEQSSIEEGNFVQPGQSALVLVGQSELEIIVSLSPEEVRHLDPVSVALGSGYKLAAGPNRKAGKVLVSWMPEGVLRQSWEGRLGRLENVDNRNRTFRYVVMVTNPWKKFNPLRDVPLTAGMFCRVSLPGRAVTDAVRLPRELIEDGKIPIVLKSRLEFIPVAILRRLVDGVLVSGVKRGTKIVSTKIPYPTRGMALTVEQGKEAAQ